MEYRLHGGSNLTSTSGIVDLKGISFSGISSGGSVNVGHIPCPVIIRRITGISLMLRESACKIWLSQAEPCPERRTISVLFARPISDQCDHSSESMTRSSIGIESSGDIGPIMLDSELEVV
jgi:hypothetical protein